MFKKIVKVFYGTDCLPYKDKELTVHYPITGNSFLGASNSTEIRFYIDKIGDIEDTWVANSKLPNGIQGNYLFQNADKGEDEDGHYLALEVSSFYTQAKGDVYISLNGFYGGVQIDDSGDVPVISGVPTIQATGCIKFSVYYATPLIDGDEVEQITLAQVLAEIGTKLDKSSHKYLKVIDNINQINNDPNNAEFYFANDIVYDKTSKEFYSIGGTFPNLTSTAIRLYFGNLDVDNLFAENIQVSGDLEVSDFSHIISFDGDEAETLVEYVDRVSKSNDRTIFAMTSNPMNLTIEQTSLLVNNDNLKIRFTYNDRVMLFEKAFKLGTNQVYLCNFEFEDTTTESGKTFRRKTTVAISLDITNRRLNAGTVLSDFYNKTQADTLLDLKADKTYVDSNFAHSIDLSIDENYDLVVKLLDKSGTELARDDIDLPLESIVVSATYYDTYTYDGTTYSKVIVIVLATTDVPTIIPVGDLVSGLATTTDLSNGLATKQNVIDSTNKLSADLVEDGTTNKVFTATEQTKLSGIESGAQVNVLDGVQFGGIDLTITDKKVNIELMNTTTDIEYVMED